MGEHPDTIDNGRMIGTSFGKKEKDFRGPLAQHGRAPQWHCGGHRFDPGTVHFKVEKRYFHGL